MAAMAVALKASASGQTATPTMQWRCSTIGQQQRAQKRVA